MERVRRLSVILGILLCVGLALLLGWAMFGEKTDFGPKPPTRADPGVTAPIAAAAEAVAASPVPSEVQPAMDGGRIQGRVLDAATRAPVTEFEVRLRVPRASEKRNEAPISRSFRSAAGQFAWRGAPPGTWRVTVMAKGYQRFELEELRIAKGAPAAQIIAPLIRGHRLIGHVFDEATRASLRGARITYREAHLSQTEGFQRRDIEARSRDDGSFVLEGVPAGRITVTAYADDYAYREQEIVVNEETARIEIGLGRGGVIAGQLTQADGTAIAGSVTAHHIDGRGSKMGETDASGQFSFDRLPAGRYQVMGRAGGSSTSRLEVFLAENERIDTLVLALRKGRSVRGVVRGLTPEQLESVSVVLETGARGTPAIARLDSAGAYAMHGVPAGSAELSVSVWDSSGNSASVSYRHSLQIDVPEDADLTVNFDIASGYRLSGRVTQGGAPKAGNMVWVRPVRPERPGLHSGRTAANGEYEVKRLPPGEYELHTDGDSPRRLRVSGDTELDIELPSYQLAGRIVEEGTSVPIVGCGIHILNLKPEEPRVRVYQESDHAGEFSAIGLEPGELLLSVYKPGYEMFRERLTYSLPLSGMTIRLRRNPGVALSVVDGESGRGIREVFLRETIGETDGIGLWVRLDENGTGSLPGALAGSTLRIAGRGGYEPALIRKWNAQPLDLRLKKRSTEASR